MRRAGPQSRRSSVVLITILGMVFMRRANSTARSRVVKPPGAAEAPASPALGQKLKARGIVCAPRYIQKPAFRCQVFADQRTFGNSRFPFTLARPEAVDYRDELFPGTLAALEQVLVLPWNELYTSDHVRAIADAVRESAQELLDA